KAKRNSFGMPKKFVDTAQRQLLWLLTKTDKLITSNEELKSANVPMIFWSIKSVFPKMKSFSMSIFSLWQPEWKNTAEMLWISLKPHNGSKKICQELW